MKYVLAAALFTATTASQALELTEDQQRLLTAEFVDPDSALFRDVRQSERHDFVICGEVNAKNRYGGYVGYKKFWLVVDDLEVGIEPNLEWNLHARIMGCD